jgi:hypothetical protein
MKTVKLNKEKLIEVITKNRAGHRSAFDQAFDGYRKECISVLEENIRNLKEKKAHIVRFNEYAPEDHTEDYDTVLEMLAMSVDPVVELTHQEFENYVRDNWDWKERWAASNLKYSNK